MREAYEAKIEMFHVEQTMARRTNRRVGKRKISGEKNRNGRRTRKEIRMFHVKQ